MLKPIFKSNPFLTNILFYMFLILVGVENLEGVSFVSLLYFLYENEVATDEKTFV